MRLVAAFLILMLPLAAKPKKTAVRSSPMKMGHVKGKAKKHAGGRLTPRKRPKAGHR
jgi:hypothetical protein